MKRKFTALRTFFLLAFSLLACFALFGCDADEPSAPQVTDVAITAADGAVYGKAGELHRITYVAPEGSEVSFSVRLGGSAAGGGDYARLDEGYVFYTAGTYTVTVYAAKDGMLGSGSATVTIQSAELLGEVRLFAASGEAYGKAGALHVLSFSSREGSEAEVTIEKEGEAATDAVYDGALRTVVFGSAGKYTVTVTVTDGEEHASGKAEIEVSATDAPEVGLTLGKKSAKENEEISFTRSVVFAKGDSAISEEISVLYRKNSREEYRAAEEETYFLGGEKFMPRIAGEWELVLSVLTRGGAAAEATARLTCRPAEIALRSFSERRIRVQTGQAAEIGYLVTGTAENYDVTFDTHGNENVTAEAGEGSSVRVTAAQVDYFTVTVVYTHKVNRSTIKSLDLDFYSVESLTYAPAFGEDPFDGMPSDVLTSMGHRLYFDAHSCGGEERELTAEYEVVKNNVTAETGSNAVEILFAADDGVTPYVIVSNYDNNVARGKFLLRLTVKDPFTGYFAVAEKEFNVIPTTNDNAAAAKCIEDYVEAHADYYQMNGLDFSSVCSDSRHNMVLTKTGTIINRAHPDWALRSNNADNADFAKIGLSAPAQDCRLEFKYRIFAPNPNSGNTWLGIGLCTKTKDGWAGFFDLHTVNGKLAVTHSFAGAKNQQVFEEEMPLAKSGTTLYVCIDRKGNGGLAEYTISVKTEKNGEYRKYLRVDFNVSDTAGNLGAPIAEYRFTHRNAGGTYSLEEVSLSALS